METSTFYKKLNKVDGKAYVIEEEIRLMDGAYEAELQHDNINEATFAVFTGPKLTGTRLETYTLSTPSLTPWKRVVRVYGNVPAAYISYETEGDTVEGDDINRVQEAIAATQKALNKEESRALEEERILEEGLRAEEDRARLEEARLGGRIDSEAMRAQDAEQIMRNGLSAEAQRAASAEEAIRDTITANSPNWNDKYTRNEVDNKCSLLETAIDWKEAVDTHADLASAYPHPDDGWTVNVKDTDYTYRWSGTAWVAISANAIPKATQGVDGLLSKEDKTSYDEAYSKRHSHSNKSALDKLTEILLSNWTDAYNKRHEHGNHSVLDKITQTLLDKLNGIASGAEVNVQSDWTATDTSSDAYIMNKPSTFPPSSHTHTELAQTVISSNTSSGDAGKYCKLATVRISSRFGFVSRTYECIIGAHGSSDSDYLRLNLWFKQQNEFGKEPYVFLSVTANDTTIERVQFYAVVDELNASYTQISLWVKVTSNYTTCLLFTMAKSDTNGTIAYHNNSGYIASLPDTGIITEQTDCSNRHRHTKAQITDFPLKLSLFTNDAGYITQGDVDTSQNHTHANKTVLDFITQAMLDKLAGIAEGANKYVHPTTAGNKHIPSGGTSGQILKWSADGTVAWAANTAGTAVKWATARNINGMSVQGDANRVNYGICSTEAAAAEKLVSCNGFSLITGAEITVKFTVTNTAVPPTLNVNGTGAKAIYYRGVAIPAGYLAANRTYAFRYNGAQYDLVGDVNTNTTNAVGSTDSSSKLFLIGAVSQASSVQTYSHDTAYVGTDGCLYSGGKKVSTTDHHHDSAYLKKGAITWNYLKGV